MEARATLKEASVSRTFVAAILVLVAMGLGAMGGYIAKGAGATSTGAPQVNVVRSNQIDRSSHEDPAVKLPAANSSPSAAPKNGTHGDHGNLS